jgi:tagaturonate reductase
MLLRGLCDACVDAANRAGHFDGGIVALQSTERGKADLLNAQHGAFTLIERGVEAGRVVERAQRIEAITRALRVDSDWAEICTVAASPDVRVVLSNVTEAGFREQPFHRRLTALLYERFRRLGSTAPRLFVIPTELVERNGDVLAKHVAAVAETHRDAEFFVRWIGSHVRFYSSLVDRIVTGTPSLQERVELESKLGYRDELITLCEPYRLWAIEGDPDELRAAFPIDGPATGVVFTSSIAPLCERKIRLLNGTHTALAPLALLAGVETVRNAMEHELLGPFIKYLLLREIVPATMLAKEEATAFAHDVIERFRNPWLQHSWRAIANGQAHKFRERVVPSIVGYAARFGRAPRALLFSLTAHLLFTDPTGSVAHALAQEDRWGASLAAIPGLTEGVTRARTVLVRFGWAAALATLTLHHE